MTTISNGIDTITPDLVLGYSDQTYTTNVEHIILGGGMTVSLGDDLPREGKLDIFFLNRADAWAARDFHKTAAVFSLVDAALPELNMSYVRKSDQGIRLDPETRIRWILSIGFREVNP